jgi:hypothetical protein
MIDVWIAPPTTANRKALDAVVYAHAMRAALTANRKPVHNHPRPTTPTPDADDQAAAWAKEVRYGDRV